MKSPSPLEREGWSEGSKTLTAPDALKIQRAPDRRVIRRLVAVPGRLVDVAFVERVRRLRRQQQVIDAQAFVALPASGLIVPESVAMRLGAVQRAERVDIAEVE